MTKLPLKKPLKPSLIYLSFIILVILSLLSETYIENLIFSKGAVKVLEIEAANDPGKYNKIWCSF